MIHSSPLACAFLLLLLSSGVVGSPQAPLSFVEEAKLVDDDPAPGEQGGWSVAIDGDTVVMGVPRDSLVSGSFGLEGTARVYRRVAGNWTLEADLTARHPGIGAQFGESVAISGDTIAVGRTGDDTDGSVHVFVRNGATWVQQAKLIAIDPDPVLAFGTSLDVDGDSIVVGSRSGKLYVFVRQGATWGQQATLAVGSDSTWIRAAIDGGTIVAGDAAYRQAHVFVRQASTWNRQATLVPADWIHAHSFGWSVAVDGDTVLVGAVLGDASAGTGAGDGTAYVFRRSGTSWSQEARLFALDLKLAHTPANFGFSVDLQGDLAVVGMNGGGGLGVYATGGAYVYSRTGSTWTRELKLTASDGATFDAFGIGVALDGRRVAVGAFQDDHGGVTDAGSAYVFELGR